MEPGSDEVTQGGSLEEVALPEQQWTCRREQRQGQDGVRRGQSHRGEMDRCWCSWSPGEGQVQGGQGGSPGSPSLDVKAPPMEA